MKANMIHMLNEIYKEAVLLCQEMSYAYLFLMRSDKLAFLFAIVMLIGVFLPWFSAQGFFTETGLMGGGDLHFILSLLTIVQAKRVFSCQMESARNPQAIPLLRSRLRRISLSYLGIGLTSTSACLFILIYINSQFETINNAVQIRIGFYITMMAGIGLFFCGLERFSLNRQPGQRRSVIY